MKTSISLKKMVVTAMFAAIACVATMVISIPIPATNGYVNIGDCVVILSAWMLGGVYGMLAGGIGSMLADVFLGYMTFAPGTLIIKALMALAAYAVYKALAGKTGDLIGRCVSAFSAEAVMVIGYFLYEYTVLGYGVGAVPSIFSNMVQGVGGMVISVVLVEVLKASGFLGKIKKL